MTGAPDCNLTSFSSSHQSFQNVDKPILCAPVPRPHTINITRATFEHTQHQGTASSHTAPPSYGLTQRPSWSSRLLQNRLSCFAPVSLIRCWFHSFQQLTKRSNNIDNGKANPGTKWKFLIVSMATDSISSWPEADTMCEADGCAGCSSELKCACSYTQ